MPKGCQILKYNVLCGNIMIILRDVSSPFSLRLWSFKQELALLQQVHQCVFCHDETLHMGTQAHMITGISWFPCSLHAVTSLELCRTHLFFGIIYEAFSKKLHQCDYKDSRANLQNKFVSKLPEMRTQMHKTLE